MPKYTVPKRMTVAAWGAPSDVSIQHQGPAGPYTPKMAGRIVPTKETPHTKAW